MPRTPPFLGEPESPPTSESPTSQETAPIKGPIISQTGKFSIDDVAANLKGVTDPAQKVKVVQEYLDALKVQRESAGKRFDMTLGMSREGGIVFYGPSRGQASPVGAAGEVNRNVIYVHPDGKVYNLTLEGLVNPKFRAVSRPIMDVDLVKGQAVEVPH